MRRKTGAAAQIRRGAITLAAFVAVAASAAGCGPADKAGSAAGEPSAAPSKSPNEILLASIPDDSKGPFRFSGKDATSNISGSVDPAAKSITLSTSMKDQQHGFTMKMSFLIIDQQTWVKISFTGHVAGLPKLPNKWLKLDRTKLKEAASIPAYDGADQGNTGPLLDAAAKVEDKGSGEYAGVIDLTQGEAGKVLDSDQMTALGAAAKAIPFHATVGADKNLASLTLDIPAAGKAKAFQYVVKYQDYGTAPKLAAPAAGQAQNAPALAYQLLNG